MDNKHKDLVPIGVCRSEDWTTNVYRLTMMREWCQKNNVEVLEIGGVSDRFPHTVLISEQDAVAFRLKFGNGRS
jgi:hypothetical protein